MSNAETPPPPLPPVAKKKRGCFFYGCLTSAIVLVLLIVGAVVVAKISINFANRMIAQYGDTNALALPTAELTSDEMKALVDRITTFSDSLEDHTNAAPLVLTARQVNALIANRPELADYKGDFFVSFAGGQTKAQISIPLEKVPKLRLLDVKGRYLNGSGTFDLAINNGYLSVLITSLEVKGKPVPPDFLAKLRSQNLAESANRGPNTNVFQQIESLQVTNGTLVIQPKSN